MYLPYALAMSRQDELQRTAATYRLAAQAPKARVKRRPHLIAAPVRRLVRLRPYKLLPF